MALYLVGFALLAIYLVGFALLDIYLVGFALLALCAKQLQRLEVSLAEAAGPLLVGGVTLLGGVGPHPCATMNPFPAKQHRSDAH